MMKFNQPYWCAPSPKKIIWINEKRVFKIYFLALTTGIIISVILFGFFEGFEYWYVVYFIWAELTGLCAFIIAVFYEKIKRLNRKICYDPENKALLILRKNNEIILTMRMDDIESIITSPFEDDFTLIETTKRISRWMGPQLSISYSGGEFGLMLCEEFKKYWENKGYKVHIERKKIPIFGERVICTKEEKY